LRFHGWISFLDKTHQQLIIFLKCIPAQFLDVVTCWNKDWSELSKTNSLIQSVLCEPQICLYCGLFFQNMEKDLIVLRQVPKALFMSGIYILNYFYSLLSPGIYIWDRVLQFGVQSSCVVTRDDALLPSCVYLQTFSLNVFILKSKNWDSNFPLF